MLSDLQAVLLLIGAVITFISYHMIPTDFHRLSKSASGRTALSDLMNGTIGHLFIRYCGTDHIIIGGIMSLAALGAIRFTSTAGWIIVGSELLLASVSATTAYAIRRAR